MLSCTFQIWMDHQNMSEHVLCMVLYLIELGLDNQVQDNKGDEVRFSGSHWPPVITLHSQQTSILQKVVLFLPGTLH